jgi:hypothetical protein
MLASAIARRIVMALPQRQIAQVSRRYSHDPPGKRPHRLTFVDVIAAKAVVGGVSLKTHT